MKELSPTTSRSSTALDIRGIPDSLSFDKIISGGTCPVGDGSLVLLARDTPRAFFLC